MVQLGQTKKSKKLGRRIRPLKCTLDIHDRTQIEFDMFYSALSRLSRQHAEHTRLRRVDCEIYIALPPQLKWDAAQYPKQQFYQDMRGHIRLREPRLSFRQLLGERMVALRESPLVYMERTIDAARFGLSDRKRGKIQSQAQIFACAFYSAMSRKYKKTVRQLNAAQTEDDLEAIEASFGDLESFMRRALQVLKKWRRIYSLYREVLTSDEHELRTELCLVDEYCSHIIAERILELMSSTMGVSKSAAANRLQRMCRLLLAMERTYSNSCNYPWVDPEEKKNNLEEIYHRRRSLRRHIWSVFFVTLRPETLWGMRRQLGPSIAAALAAVWATLANYWIISYMIQESKTIDISTAIVGVNGALILAASAVAYAMKDRIKEMGRNYFASGRISGQFDHAFGVQMPLPLGKTAKLGSIREAVQHVPWRHLDKGIKELLHPDQYKTNIGELPRTIICYRRTVMMRGSSFGKYSIAGVGIQDILRFNFERLMPLLDEPIKIVKGINKQGQLKTILLPKVYYFDVITRMSQKHPRDYQHLEHDRVTITKEGITRLQRLTQTRTDDGFDQELSN